VSLHAGHAAAADLEPDELAALIAMYTTAVDELAETRDPGVNGLAQELLTLRAEATLALSQVGSSRQNGAGAEL
jgi:hypothetical protein